MDDAVSLPPSLSLLLLAALGCVCMMMQAPEPDPRAVAVYGPFYQWEEQKAANIAKASPPSVTSDAILHALAHPHPKTRYGGWVGGWGRHTLGVLHSPTRQVGAGPWR